MANVTFPITGDPAADQLLIDDPLALLIGMLLDQQVPMSWAFRGPASLSARLGGLDAGKIAAMSEDDMVAAFRDKPALHRFPGSMGKRTYALCRVIVDEYDGDAANIWPGVTDPKELLARMKVLPGFGDEKAKIFLAVLGKRFALARGLGEGGQALRRRVPAFGSGRRLTRSARRVRSWKKAQKAKGKTKAE